MILASFVFFAGAAHAHGVTGLGKVSFATEGGRFSMSSRLSATLHDSYPLRPASASL